METATSAAATMNGSPADQAAGQARCREARMLVVEDDSDLEPVLRRVLDATFPDLAVDWAKDAPTARALLGERSYAIVLVDQVLGEGGSGLGLRLCCRRTQPRATFAVMSAWPLSEFLHSAGGAGTPFLPKPFSLAGCRAFLRGLLRASDRATDRRPGTRRDEPDALEGSQT